MMIFKHAAAQFGAALAAVGLWAAADSWYTRTDMPLANGISMALAALAGLAVATVVHEWFHLMGAQMAGAVFRIPDKLGLFIYDYDFSSNSLGQFNTMSVAGQLGSWVAVVLLFMSVPLDNAGRAMLGSGALGGAVFAGVIELPPLLRAQASGNPLAELSKINGRVLGTAGVAGVMAAAATWYLVYQ